MNKNKLFSFLALWLGISGIGQAQTADLQVIHNCADPAAATVDVYVNGNLALDNFAFRTATPFLNLPAGVTLDLGIAPGSSTSVSDTLVNIPVVLDSGERYIAVASGVLDPAAFAPNPDAVSTGFQLLITGGVRTASLNAGEVDFKVLHGATDAPTVDVIAQGVATLVDDAPYTAITPYISVPAGSYVLNVTPGNNNAVIVASYVADLTSLADSAAFVFASGFLDPSLNNSGEAFGLYAALPSGAVIALPQVGNARLQIIHNSADPAAALVDIYVNGALLLDDFGFREATPFVDVPSAVTLNIGIAPDTSTSAASSIATIPVVLSDNGTYVAVASGVLNPASFATNPDAIPTGFQLLLFDSMQELSSNPANVEFAVLHGSTDAPAVDIYARNVAQLVNDAAYTDATPYISVPAANYLIDITPAAGSPVLKTYFAPVSPLAGAAAVIFASGFFDPAANQNGESFTVLAALPNGLVVELPDTSIARLQVIHNSADPAAANVDIYANGALILDDFAFRTATPYLDVPADVTINIGVAPGTSTSAADTLVNVPVVLANGGSYVAVASGVLSPASFAVNPNGISTGFQLLLQDSMTQTATNANEIDFRVVHGSTDAPAVDIDARNVGNLVSNAAYTDITGILSVPSNTYVLDIKPAGSNTIVASFEAPLNTIAGQSAVVFASGFLDPAANQNGEAFGVCAALPNGNVVCFQQVSLARLQVVHNCADPAADSVDVYVDGNLLLDNFAFRTATPYIDVPGTLNVGIAPKTSTSVNDTLVSYNVTLENNGTYVAVASGVLAPANFAVNPDGRPTGFTLLLQDSMREESNDPATVNLRVVHGATDAPTVDVVVPGFGPIVNDIAYSDFTGYSNTFPGVFPLNITPANNNTVVVASFLADISGLAGNAALLFASGFLDPAANQNGPAFGLCAALPNGTVVCFPAVSTGIEETTAGRFNAYPNPASTAVTINSIDNRSITALSIVDLSGKVVMAPLVNQGSTTAIIDISGLANGLYTIQIQTETGSGFTRLSVVK